MFNLYKYNIHVLFVLLPKHGGNSSTVIVAGLLRFHPYWVCPVCVSVWHFWGLVARTCLSGHWSATCYRVTNSYSLHGVILIQERELFCIASMSPICISAEEVLKWY